MRLVFRGNIAGDIVNRLFSQRIALRLDDCVKGACRTRGVVMVLRLSGLLGDTGKGNSLNGLGLGSIVKPSSCCMVLYFPKGLAGAKMIRHVR